MAESENDVEIVESRIIEEGGEPFDVIIVGAGAAGVGVAIALGQAGIENLLLVDRDTVGSSFASWPEETRFITPSFPSNSIGMLHPILLNRSGALQLRIGPFSFFKRNSIAMLYPIGQARCSCA